ncbi:hypothetical protein KAI32_02325 [Candidatus Pacearchaeota archaeon]|nr:hypothetical protein [Candidatus Pacearchaeota archaeon]
MRDKKVNSVINRKKGQFNFVWLFAILAGTAILILAIYGAMKAGDTMRFQTDTEIAKSISIISDPLQAGFSEGSFGKILFKQETRINNFCFDDRFGRHSISVSTKSDVGEAWNIPGEQILVHNKYIFSSEASSGIEYFVFSKPFEFPYKVADLVFLTSDKYCFLNAPDEIVDEIEGMNIPNIEIENCTGEDVIRVCFGSGSDCDVRVRGSCLSGCESVYDWGSVERYGLDMKYVGSLMYAAIFSDKEIYDCNVRRLMYRTGMIAQELVDKADLMDARSCNTNLKVDLIYWNALTINSSSEDLGGLYSVANGLDRKNDREICGLWN